VGPSVAVGELLGLGRDEVSAGRYWYTQSVARIGHSDTSRAEIFCSEESLPKVLDILSKYEIRPSP